MARAFSAAGYTVLRAPSDWRIGPGFSGFAASVAEGHANAARARLPGHRPAIAAWLAARQRQALRGMLSARIGHRDLLALPPG
jgi:hypothetical protein